MLLAACKDVENQASTSMRTELEHLSVERVKAQSLMVAFRHLQHYATTRASPVLSMSLSLQCPEADGAKFGLGVNRQERSALEAELAFERERRLGPT